MSKKVVTPDIIEHKVMGMVDPRATMDDSIVLKRQRATTMNTFFKTDQMSAVAYFVSDLVAKGFNDKQILDVVNPKYNLKWNLNAVRTCKALLRKVWRAETACQLDDQIAQELASIQTQEKEAWEAWEFSKRGIKKKSTRNTTSRGDAPEGTYDLTEVINDEATTAGDIKFLQHINDLHKEKRKLLGLYAPEKKNIGGAEKSGTTAIQFNVVGGDAGDNVSKALSELLGGGLSTLGVTQSQPVEEAQVVESKPVERTNDEVQAQVDKIFAEMMEE